MKEEGPYKDDDIHLEHRMLTPFLSKKIPPIPDESERKPYPYHSSNFLYRIFFWWIFPVMRVGYKRTLRPEDLWYLDEKWKVEYYHAQFAVHLEDQLAEARAEHAKVIEKKKAEGTYNSEDDDEFLFPKYALVKALYKTFRWEYGLSVLCFNLTSIAQTLDPLLTKALINYVEKRSLGLVSEVGRGIGYAIGASLMIFVSGILQNHSFHLSMMVGAMVKATLTKSLLEKSFRLNAKGRQKFSAGKITSIMGTDLARIDLAVGFQPTILAFPVPVIIAIALLIVNIGVAALAGIALFVVSIAIIGFSTKSLFEYRKKAQVHTDMRVGLTKELLTNFRMIKFYSWEDSYIKSIGEVRNKEMKIIFNMQSLRGAIMSYAISLSQVASMVAFLVLYAVSKSKNPANIFSSLSLFTILTQQIMMVPMSLASSADALNGVKRVSSVLQCGEVNQEEQDAFHSHPEVLEEKNLAIKVTDADFEWKAFQMDEDELEQIREDKAARDKKHAQFEEEIASISSATGSDSEKDPEKVKFKGLTDINLEIKKGEFVVITGLIGSGKSSLLSAIAGFMHKTSGSVKINGSLLLCGQPWIQNATVKENIIFGAKYDEKLYHEIIRACSLTADLKVLPAGDETEIGERGITLSGGQKARVNLARAVYANKDIILLDDVLSAVDARVGKHIMDNCLLGLLAGNTRILATHQLSLIGAADRVIFLNGSGTVDVGTVDELKATNEGFRTLMSFTVESTDSGDPSNAVITEAETEQLAKKDFEKEEGPDLVAGDGQLIGEEERAVNAISMTVYKRYISAGSGVFKSAMVVVPLILGLITIAAFCNLFTNTWLSFWSEERFDRSNGFYIGIYIAFSVLSIIFMFCEFTLLAYSGNQAAKNLNIGAIKRLVRAPVAFMDTTPMGRILNRFTKDSDSLDNEVSQQYSIAFVILSGIIGVLILCIIYLPWFGIAVPFLVLIFLIVSTFYQSSGREIKRLEAVQRSFVYNNFNEVLNGVLTIKAYKMEKRFLDKNNHAINRMNEAYYLTIANQRWLGIHLDAIATIMCLIISILCVTRQFHISAASVGLLLSYVLQISGQISLLVRILTQVENDMNSAERLLHYAYDLQQEAAAEVSETKPRSEWPELGEIDFKNVSLRYRPALPLVLKNMSLHVEQGEKIGICGRTGAGKSSIMTALFRIAEMSEGTITIDGIDISKIGLKDLRSKLSIIPQDPVLLRGSIRKNLDPFDDHSDEKLWTALRKSGLVDDLSSVKKQTGEDMHKFHLDQVVEDDGVNFSLGERQLIALARAVVRDSKILILDEATSSVDYETDAKIQSTIVKEFGHCTILCVAHRLKTILDYDKVLVLDQGEVKEFDTPWHLFNNTGGIFQSMCETSHIVADDFHRKDWD